MKRLYCLLLVITVGLQSALAWNAIGHKIIVHLATQHLTPTAQKNIARYIPNDLVKEASWMDTHRKDKEINYTTYWHSFYYNPKSLRHDMNYTLRRGDALRALSVIEYNLPRYRELTDSAVVMNLRMVLHVVGDMHCPCHAAPYRTRAPQLMFNGQEIGFHKFFDRSANYVHPKMSYQEIVRKIDIYNEKKRNVVVQGTPEDWAHETARNVHFIWTKYTQPRHPIEITPKIKKMVDTQLRNAGYRLAALLNRYFGE